MKPADAFALEVIEETIGMSHKKWALLVLAFVAGAMGALWLVRRAGSVEPVIAADADAEPSNRDRESDFMPSV